LIRNRSSLASYRLRCERGGADGTGSGTVAVHFIGADRDDLACLRDVEQGGVIALAATRVGFGA
jgi:hypothetical protein